MATSKVVDAVNSEEFNCKANRVPDGIGGAAFTSHGGETGDHGGGFPDAVEEVCFGQGGNVVGYTEVAECAIT